MIFRWYIEGREINLVMGEVSYLILFLLQVIIMGIAFISIFLYFNEMNWSERGL